MKIGDKYVNRQSKAIYSILSLTDRYAWIRSVKEQWTMPFTVSVDSLKKKFQLYKEPIKVYCYLAQNIQSISPYSISSLKPIDKDSCWRLGTEILKEWILEYTESN